MKLRFNINQPEALRRGYDAPTSTVTITIDPADLSQEERDLLADRMRGIDVYELTVDSPPAFSQLRSAGNSSSKHPPTKQRGLQPIVTKVPTYDALIEAVRQNEQEVQAELHRLNNAGTEVAAS